jgi:hypothetical protein
MIAVAWNATDDMTLPSNSINITYGNSTVGWTSIAIHEENDGAFLWDTSSVLCPGIYWINISVYDSASLTTYDESNYSFEIVCPDTTPPTITEIHPLNGSTIIRKQLGIIANYIDETGINTTSVILKVDGIDVTSSANITETGISYDPPISFEEGVHTVYLEVSDNSSNHNKASVTWSFTFDDSPTGQGNYLLDYWWLFLITILGCLLVIALYQMMRKSRRKRKEPPETREEPEEPDINS